MLSEIIKRKYFYIRNKKSGLVMGVAGASTNEGARITIYDQLEAENQHYLIMPVGENVYSIAPRHTGMVIGIDGGSTARGSCAIMWPFSKHAENQKFFFEDTGGGWYKIRDKKSELVLGVAGGSVGRGAEIQQWTDNGAEDQLWQLVPAGDLPSEITERPTFHLPAETHPSLNSTNATKYLDRYVGYGLIGEVWVPYLCVNDPQRGNNPGWQIQNSPYYKLVASIRYQAAEPWFTYTSADGGDQFSRSITSGVSDSTSHSFTATVGASITASGGDPGVGSISVSMFFEASYNVTRTFEIHTEHTIGHQIQVPKDNAGAFWVGQIKYQLFRLSDNAIVNSWEVPKGPVYSDTYPD